MVLYCWLELLLKRKDVQVETESTEQERSALSYAVSEGHEEIVQLPLGAGSKANLSDKNGLAPLMYAALAGQERIASRLIAIEDLRISVQSGSLFTALAYDVLKGHEGVIKQLLCVTEMDVNAQGKEYRRKLLMLALTDDRWDIAGLILNHPDVNVNIRDVYDRTPHDYLVKEGKLASQYRLAATYQAGGQVPRAVALLESMFHVVNNILPPYHLDRLTSQHKLALACRVIGQLQEAVELLEGVVGVDTNVLAPDHPLWLVLVEILAEIRGELAIDSIDMLFSEELSDN